MCSATERKKWAAKLKKCKISVGQWALKMNQMETLKLKGMILEMGNSLDKFNSRMVKQEQMRKAGKMENK